MTVRSPADGDTITVKWRWRWRDLIAIRFRQQPIWFLVAYVGVPAYGLNLAIDGLDHGPERAAVLLGAGVVFLASWAVLLGLFWRRNRAVQGVEQVAVADAIGLRLGAGSITTSLAWQGLSSFVIGRSDVSLGWPTPRVVVKLPTRAFASQQQLDQLRAWAEPASRDIPRR